MYAKNDLDRDISQIWTIYTTSYEYFNCLNPQRITRNQNIPTQDLCLLLFIQVGIS